ncbi:uncharacterized protein VTP21DRAFT_8293 [Calcarisporiella thermophila]|uniref:uncharacterized protein n=1 Tax=Calcarisporiella thermophila TaxID=911321 RepID=UPI003743E398
MPRVIEYLSTTFVFTISLAFTFYGLLTPDWLIFTPPKPFRMETHYGLFEKCSQLTGECRRFPLQSAGDCEEENFCEKWQLAGYSLVTAAIIASFTWISLIGIMCGGRRSMEKGWRSAVGLFLLNALFGALSMSLIANLYNSSNTFYFGTRYGMSFILATIGWCLSLFCSVGLALSVLFGPPGYDYEPIR